MEKFIINYYFKNESIKINTPLEEFIDPTN